MASQHHHDDHGEHDHHHDDGHHQEGPVIVTELVPEKSPEDNFLVGVALACYATLCLCIVSWGFFPEIEVSAHHGAGAEHTEHVEH